VAKFSCPHWVQGQSCKPYFHVHWSKRLVAAAVGISATLAAPVVNCITAVSHSPPAAPIAVVVWAWGILLAIGVVASIVITLHNEHDVWGCFISGVGIPALMVALISSPHLV
jgi:hypothetical protein